MNRFPHQVVRIVAGILVGGLAIPARGDTPQQKAAERLKWEMESWRSIELRVRHKMTRRAPDPKGRPMPFDRFEIRYVQTALGRRLKEQESFLGDAQRRRVRYFFDGRRGADIEYGGTDFQDMVQVIVLAHFPTGGNPGVFNCAEPLNSYYVGLEPLHMALPRAEHLRSEPFLDRPCEVFRVPEVRGSLVLDHVHHLDGETGIPLQVATYLNSRPFKEERPYAVWKATSIERVQGHPFVMNSTHVTYAPGDGTVTFERTFEVRSLVFDQDYPDSMFFPVIPSGSQVIDAVAKKTVVWPSRTPVKNESRPSASKSKPDPKPKAEPRPQAEVANPIRAEQPQPWPSAFGGVLGAAGLLLMAAGFFLWWRRP